MSSNKSNAPHGSVWMKRE